MKVAFLSSTHPPRDKRVFDKEAISLAKAGFDVTHLAPDGRDDIVEQGVRIITYPRVRGLLGRLVLLPSLYWMAARVDADCYHCNEVDSWVVGVLLKLTRRKQVVFDVHENYPHTLAESRFPRWLQPAVIGAVRLLFRLLVLFTDRIVLAKRSVADDFKRVESKHVLAENFTPLAYFTERQSGADGSQPDNPRAPLTAIHLGLISRPRGWPQLLDALAFASHDNIQLKIIGTFNDGSQADFERQSSELGLRHRITIINWLPFEQAFEQLLAADIGLVLFQPGFQNHIDALPHKMFDYMLAAIPLIAPKFATEVSHIIREADCGLLVDSSQPTEIALALDRLVSDPVERRRLGDNGRRSVFTHYNWEREAEKLVGMYRELAHSDR